MLSCASSHCPHTERTVIFQMGYSDMLDVRSQSPADRVAGLIQQIFTQRALTFPGSHDEDLRGLGLSSLDMVNLVLSVETEFNVTIPEVDITPKRFRSISTISDLVSGLLMSAESVGA
jgi:acyl carrier protein